METIESLRKKAKESGEPVLREKSFQFLLSLIKEKQPKEILEVGTNVGLTGIAMLIASKNSHLTGIEIDEKKANLAKENYKLFNVNSRAKILLGSASEIIPILSGKYDFIFLDGPKGHYYEYSDYLIDLLNINGVLFADNVLFRGYVNDKVKTPHRFATAKHSLENYIKKITQDENLKTNIFEIEDGISVSEKIK